MRAYPHAHAGLESLDWTGLQRRHMGGDRGQLFLVSHWLGHRPAGRALGSSYSRQDSGTLMADARCDYESGAEAATTS